MSFVRTRATTASTPSGCSAVLRPGTRLPLGSSFAFRVSNGAAGLELLSQGAFEKHTELARARRVAQLAQRLGFDLADALAGDGERLAYFSEGVLAAVVQTEAHLEDLFLAPGERLQH